MSLSYLQEIDNIWGHIFMEECAKLSESEPWLDSEELEAKAEERTNHFIYLYHKERLPDYHDKVEWRADLR